MTEILEMLGVAFILMILLAPFLLSGVYNRGRAAGIEWARAQVYPARGTVVITEQKTH